MRDKILKLANDLDRETMYTIATILRNIVAAEDARLRDAQTDARCACDGEPDGE